MVFIFSNLYRGIYLWLLSIHWGFTLSKGIGAMVSIHEMIMPSLHPYCPLVFAIVSSLHLCSIVAAIVPLLASFLVALIMSSCCFTTSASFQCCHLTLCYRVVVENT